MNGRLLCALALVPIAIAADNGPFKVAPPPPASWQRDRVADLTARRKAVMEQIGDRAVLVLYAAEPRNYANDVDWPFRQENDFFYLTGLTQPGATLVLAPGGGKVREMLFLPASDPSRESWTGHMITPSEARDTSGIADVFEAGQWNNFISTLIPRARGARDANPETPAWGGDFAKLIEHSNNGELQLYMILPVRTNSVEYRREQDFAAKIGSLGAGVAIKDATAIFSGLRHIKSRRELDILQHAVDITAEAFQRAFAFAIPGTWEYEIQAQFEFTFLRRNSHWGYPCIVGSGANATTLHYQANKDRMKAGDLLLMDDAAEFDQYSVDVTRTIPVSGKFTTEQADIYRLVYDAQAAAIAKVRPGHTNTGGPDSVQGAATEVFKQGLFKLGLITDPSNGEQVRIWFNHGIGHGIGLNVHDPGGREFQKGMAVTVEPGLYFRPDALENLPKTPEMEKFKEAVRPAFEKYKGIGVRIEDDVVVTEGEPIVISAAIPSKLEDVEASIAKLRAAVNLVP